MTNIVIFLIFGVLLKITYKGDYALKALLDLSFRYQDGHIVPITDISRRQNIPEKYLEQIMLILKGAGYVDSKRGTGGGFFLLKSPQEITIGEIVRLIEGPVEPIACGRRIHDFNCGEEDLCAFREVWVKVTETISSIVDDVTFAHLMKRAEKLREQNMGYMYQI